MLEYLHGRGVGCLRPNAGSGATALHVAAAVGNLEVVQFLVGRLDGDPEQRNGAGASAFALAADGGHRGVVEWLALGRPVNAAVAIQQRLHSPCDWPPT